MTHYFSLNKARKQLNFKPQKYDMKDIVEWFKEKRHRKRISVLDRNNFSLILVFVALITVSIVISTILSILIHY